MSFFIRPDLNTKEVEKRINDTTLFKYYCSHFKKENVKFKSEFRKDSNPSASIINYKDKLWYKDFGDPNQEKSYNIYQFVMEKYTLTFFESLKKINEDFNLGLGYNSDNVIAPVKYEIKREYIEKDKVNDISKLDVRKINWTQKHIDFWTQYDIPKLKLRNLVNLFKIDPISHFWLNTAKINNRMFTVTDIGFNYDYFWHLGVLIRKIYLPHHKGSNFFTNSNTLVTQGWEQLPPTGDLVFVTSSMKDIVILRACGYYAVAPSNENVFIPEHRFVELKERFKNVVIFYDNDFTKDQNWGILYAQKHSEKYNIPYIVLPDNTEKDPSDFSKSFGRNKLVHIVKERLIHVGIKTS